MGRLRLLTGAGKALGYATWLWLGPGSLVADAGLAQDFPVAVLEDGGAGALGGDARHSGHVLDVVADAAVAEVERRVGDGDVDNFGLVDHVERPDESVVGVEAEDGVPGVDASVGSHEYAAGVRAAEIYDLDDRGGGLFGGGGFWGPFGCDGCGGRGGRDGGGGMRSLQFAGKARVLLAQLGYPVFETRVLELQFLELHTEIGRFVLLGLKAAVQVFDLLVLLVDRSAGAAFHLLGVGVAGLVGVALGLAFHEVGGVDHEPDHHSHEDGEHKDIDPCVALLLVSAGVGLGGILLDSLLVLQDILLGLDGAGGSGHGGLRGGGVGRYGVGSRSGLGLRRLGCGCLGLGGRRHLHGRNAATYGRFRHLALVGEGGRGEERHRPELDELLLVPRRVVGGHLDRVERLEVLLLLGLELRGEVGHGLDVDLVEVSRAVVGIAQVGFGRDGAGLVHLLVGHGRRGGRCCRGQQGRRDILCKSSVHRQI